MIIRHGASVTTVPPCNMKLENSEFVDDDEGSNEVEAVNNDDRQPTVNTRNNDAAGEVSDDSDDEDSEDS